MLRKTRAAADTHVLEKQQENEAVLTEAFAGGIVTRCVSRLQDVRRKLLLLIH